MIRGRFTLDVIHSEAILLVFLKLRVFRFRVELLPGELPGALQGCNGVVGPYSLKVGLAVRTWCSPRCFRRRRGIRLWRCLRRLSGGGYNRECPCSHCSENL